MGKGPGVPEALSTWAQAVAGRTRTASRRLVDDLHDVAPTRWTALRTPPGRVPPPPDAFASFGTDSWIVPPARVTHPERIEVGASVVVMENANLLVDEGEFGSEARLVLGDGVRLARFTTIVCRVGVVIEEEVASSDSAMIFDSWRHPGLPLDTQGFPTSPLGGPVVIEAGAYLGFNSIIYPDVRVGRGAFVGEGAVVVEDVPAHAVVYGNPASVVRRVEDSTGGSASSEKS